MFTAVSLQGVITEFQDLPDLQAGITDGRLNAGDIVFPDAVYDVVETGLSLQPVDGTVLNPPPPPPPLPNAASLASRRLGTNAGAAALQNTAAARRATGRTANVANANTANTSMESDQVFAEALKFYTDSRDIDREGPPTALALLKRALIDQGITDVEALAAQVVKAYRPRG